MGIRYVDGKRFRAGVIAGAGWVRHMREHLNKINVFPVPDGDTGTNMALSLDATAEAAKGSDEGDISEASQKIAEASILGAKGNSGLIMAHWFLGFSKALGKRARIGATELAHAMGRATSQGLASRGAEVILACRSQARGEAARDAIRDATGNPAVRLERVDLSDLGSVRRLATRLGTARLDVVVHNAGVLPAERQITADGLELTWATNVVGPLLLTHELRPALRRGAGARLLFARQ